MGICDSTENTTTKTGVNKGNISILDQKPTKELDPYISKELSKEICKIVIETQKERKIGTGFILAFPIDLEWF